MQMSNRGETESSSGRPTTWILTTPQQWRLIASDESGVEEDAWRTPLRLIRVVSFGPP